MASSQNLHFCNLDAAASIPWSQWRSIDAAASMSRPPFRGLNAAGSIPRFRFGGFDQIDLAVPSPRRFRVVDAASSTTQPRCCGLNSTNLLPWARVRVLDSTFWIPRIQFCGGDVATLITRPRFRGLDLLASMSCGKETETGGCGTAANTGIISKTDKAKAQEPQNTENKTSCK